MSSSDLDCLFFSNPSSPLTSKAILRKPSGDELSITDLISNLSVFVTDSERLILTNLELIVLWDLEQQIKDIALDDRLTNLVSRLLPRSFFHFTPQELLSNFGIGVAHSDNLSNISLAQRALISKHYHRALLLLNNYYDFLYPLDQSLEHRFCASQLILRARYANRSFDIPKKHEENVLSVYEQRSICTSTRVRAQGKSYRFNLHRNMIEHLMLVSQRMIPFGVKLEEIEASELGTSDKEVQRVLEAESRPFCALVKVLGSEEDLGVLAALYDRQSDEFWVSDVDLVWLARVADLQFKRVLLSRAYVATPSNLKPPSKLFGDPLIRFSPVANTIAHIHLLALIGAQCDLNNTSTGLLSTWLKAVDKSQMLIYARLAKSNGFEVIGFGSGQLDVVVHESCVDRFKQFIVEHCFQYPCIRSIDQNLSSYEFKAHEPVMIGEEVYL